jgi:hypothetical protein
MKYIILIPLITVSLLFAPLIAFSQSQQGLNILHNKYKVIETKNSERFIFPYNASNNVRKNPLIYNYTRPIGQNWILTVQNNMSYAYRGDAKTIVKLREPESSEKFIEIAMFGNLSKKFWVAVNTKDSGYIRVYNKDVDGWSNEQPIIIAHANNQGLSVTNGKRIIVDKLSLNGFMLGSVSVYGKDDLQSLLNTYAGNISFDLAFGNPSDSPIYYLPFGALVSVGGIIIVLIVRKRREIS